MIERIQIIHGDFSDSLKEMSFESVGRVFMALIAYANDEDPSEILGDDKEAKIMYLAIKGQMSRAEDYRLKRVGNGKKGGAPFGTSNARKTTENNQKQPKTTKNNQKQAPSPSPSPCPSPLKRLYGECENVLLSDEEYQKVKDQGLEGLIEELSLYIAGTGKKYKSHYAVIRQWANRRKKEAKVIKETPFNTGYSRRADDDYDLAKLIKN